MRSFFRSLFKVSLLVRVGVGMGVGAAAMTTGCQPTSVCSPGALAATSATIVSSATSPTYRAQLASKNGVEPQHRACRAEATISVTIAAVDDPAKSDPGLNSEFSPPLGKAQGQVEQHVGYSQQSDPHLLGRSLTAATQQGQYRALGVGRGMDHDDCANAAMLACNGAVDEYFKRTRTLRTPGIVCQLNANEDVCPATTK
jgi:hypothetical protein